MDDRVVVTDGYVGWANPDTRPASSLIVYGPGGRWGGTGQAGDLLSDHLNTEHGCPEGSPVIVVASPNRFDTPEFERELRPYLERCIEAYRAGARTPDYGPQFDDV